MSDATHLQRPDVEERLQEVWGFESLRPGQSVLVDAILEGRDVLGILPTGGGKSLCYQLPALLLDGVTLVISPLIALMQDQVDGLTARGVSATFINSTLPPRVIDQRWTDIEAGRYKLVYLAPERLTSEIFQARAGRLKVSLVAIDEAHCVSEWGHHFRPAYQDIPAIRSLLNNPPFIALTATATPHVRDDVVKGLELNTPFVHVEGFDRPNIIWSVFHTENKRRKVQDVLEGVSGSGILYVATRRQVVSWERWLRNAGQAVAAYHGGMEARQREDALASWLNGDVRVMVATNAFGMGIDKPDVRFVIHAGLPGSLEAYYQEAGRAGRDGHRAFAVLLYSRNAELTQQGLIEASHPDYATLQSVYDGVSNLSQLAIGSLPDRPVTPDPRKLLAVTGLYSGQVKQAVALISRAGFWKTHPPTRRTAWLRFKQDVRTTRWYATHLTNPELKKVIESLLRVLPAEAFSEWVECNLAALERISPETGGSGSDYLDILSNQGVLDWIPPGNGMRIEYLYPRSRRLPIDLGPIRKARERARSQLREMMRYVTGTMCRRRHLLLFFGEAAPDACGQCDVCLGRHNPYVLTPEDTVHIDALKQAITEGIAPGLWPAHLGMPRWKVEAIVQAALRQEILEEEAGGTVRIKA